ncbi:MAG: hypothetical protein OES34_09575 [Nitrosopumilus sp.]|nr:hypothetical protein [Nitrosopumilus sp.]
MSFLSYHEGASPGGGRAFQSLTDALDPAPGIIPKTHFVEWFSGDALDSIWTQRDVAGTGTFAMDDSENGGFSITTGSTSGNNSFIDFDDTNHYAHDGSILISVIKNTTDTSAGQQVGLTEQAGANYDDTRATVGNNSNASFIIFNTALNSTSASVDSTIAPDGAFHKIQQRLSSTSLNGWIDDVLEVLITSNLPDVAMQPYWRGNTGSAAAKKSNVSYLEAFNT